MRGSSIFSREYRLRKKRRRRRRRITALVLIIALVGVGAFVFRGKVTKLLSHKAENNIVDSNKNNITLNNTPQDDASKIKDSENKEEPKEEKGIDIKLSNGDTIKALYEGEGDGKKFKFISGVQGNNKVDISPSGKNILVSDGTSQDIKIVNLNGEEKVLSSQQYVTKGKKVFKKENILNTNKGYNWASSAKFITETHGVFLSQLPYFGSVATDTYVWFLDITNGSQRMLGNLKGKNINIGEVKDNRLHITIDSKEFFVDENGNV